MVEASVEAAPLCVHSSVGRPGSAGGRQAATAMLITVILYLYV